MPAPKKPTQAEIAAARGTMIPDVIAPGLKVLFVGINPSLYSAAIGHHFGRPGNRFWPALYAGGFTERLLDPSEDHSLLESGYGITNIVDVATATADELSGAQLIAGGLALENKVEEYQPEIVAFLGISAYRMAFAKKKATIGRQEERMKASSVWVLPNPSGLNAHYQLPELARLFAALRQGLLGS